MATTGRLEYTDRNDVLTQIDWYKESDIEQPLYDYAARVVADGGTVESINCVRQSLLNDAEIYEFCGTDNPLEIKWGGSRYGSQSPSSATLNLKVETLKQRQWLETLFNYKFLMTVTKGGELFWMGKLSTTLGIEEYRTYPYTLRLYASDGIQKSKTRQFLMTDFPAPALTGNVSILDVIVKMIEINYYPRGTYSLYASFRKYHSGQSINMLDQTFIDPRVFMYSDKDQYISNQDLMDSLLGMLNLQLYQWKANWYVIDLEAQWNDGNIRYTKYDVADGQWSYNSWSTWNLGILDLYNCVDGPKQIEGANINFLPPWQQVTISQKFQMNNQILPVFANRTGMFYHGSVPKGESEFVPLEFITAINPQNTGNLKLWTDNGLWVAPFPNEWNEGSIKVPVVEERPFGTNNALAEVDLDDQVEFDRFFIAMKTMPLVNDLYNSQDTQTMQKIVFLLEYIALNGKVYYFWHNNNQGSISEGFDDWTDEYHQYVFDWRDISIDANMPNNELVKGGKFRLSIWDAYDDKLYGSEYGMLIYNLQLGIVQGDYTLIAPQDTDKRANLIDELWEFLPQYILEPGASTVTKLMDYALKTYKKVEKEKLQNKRSAGGVKEGNYTVDELNWDNDVIINVNPNSDVSQKFEYYWGINLIGIKSYHNVHLSSGYTQFGDAVDLWDKEGETEEPDVEALDLTTWKSREFIRDNAEYTTELMGKWDDTAITPLQLVYDFEGRVYRFTSGTWNDKAALWDTKFTEFKALKPQSGQETKCDFSQYDFMNDFCLWRIEP